MTIPGSSFIFGCGSWCERVLLHFTLFLRGLFISPIPNRFPSLHLTLSRLLVSFCVLLYFLGWIVHDAFNGLHL